jgi:hypothetical protein
MPAMLVLRVQVNEGPVVVGGANDLGVLNVIVAAVAKLVWCSTLEGTYLGATSPMSSKGFVGDVL